MYECFLVYTVLDVRGLNTLYFIFYAQSEHFQVIFLMEKSEKQQNKRREKRKKTHRIKSAYYIYCIFVYIYLYWYSWELSVAARYICSFCSFIRSFVRFTFSHHHHQHRTVSSFYFVSRFSCSSLFLVCFTPFAIWWFCSAPDAHIEIYGAKCCLCCCCCCCSAYTLLSVPMIWRDVLLYTSKNSM